MIIHRMRATFGKLVDQELRLEPGLNVISGGNETGKTTWLSFLLAMFYGLDSRERTKSGHLPDKLKYQPWSGSPMSGLMELSTEDRAITLERSSQTGPMNDFRAWDTRTGSALEEFTGSSCGLALLGVEASVYARSGFLRQQRAPISSDPQLEKRLSALVTAGSEDYAYADVDEKLKRMQTALRHNQSGALPRAEQEKQELEARIRDIADRQRRLSELEAELQALRAERDECREILAGLDALDRQLLQERVSAAEAAYSEAREDREGWEAVCRDLPEEAALQDLEAELQQLQNELQTAALEEGLSLSELELPEPDPIFGRMSPKEAHDLAAADADKVLDARAAKRPRRKHSVFWLLLILAGLGAGFAGAFLQLLPLAAGGVFLSLFGLGWWLSLRISYDRRKRLYQDLQDEAREILRRYGAESARDVVLYGIRYIRAREAWETDPIHDAAHRIMEGLADRRTDILNRINALMPGCSTPEKAAVLFQEAAQARQSLAQAQRLELQREEQLRDLRFALGTPANSAADASLLAGRDRDSENARLEDLERRMEDTGSQADKLAGAISQMGDPLELSAGIEDLGRQIRRMEERYAALRLARRALAEADEALRAKFAPLLCEKTGEFFSRLTDGKYDTVQLDRGLHVTVHPVNSPVYRPLSYLSGGTVDQLYLALRLAICELLLPGAPIVLDDALVYFDDSRAALALNTLRELSRTRQVLIFTCQSREKRLLDELARKERAHKA